MFESLLRGFCKRWISSSGNIGVSMARGRELSVDLITWIIDAHKNGERNEVLFRQFLVPVSTVQSMYSEEMQRVSDGQKPWKMGEKTKTFAKRRKKRLCKRSILAPRITSKAILKILCISGIEIFKSPLRRTLRKEVFAGCKPSPIDSYSSWEANRSNRIISVEKLRNSGLQ